MATKYPVAPVHDERMDITLPAPLKRRVFETAAERGISAATIVRQALTAFIDNQKAA